MNHVFRRFSSRFFTFFCVFRAVFSRFSAFFKPFFHVFRRFSSRFFTFFEVIPQERYHPITVQ